MKYSIIVPVYNSESVISDTLDRLLDYPNLDYEVIAVNDGSTDNTLAVLTQKQLTHKKLKVINQDNMGPSGARNTGLQSATGEWILFVDADDDLNMAIFDFLESYDENFDLLIFNYLIAIKDSTSPKKMTFEHKNYGLKNSELLNLYLDGFLNTLWNKVYKRSIIYEHLVSFDPDMRMGEDLLFNLEYLKYCKTIHFINKPFYTYTMDNPDSISKELPVNYFENQLYLFETTVDYFKQVENISNPGDLANLYGNFMKNISNYVKKAAKSYSLSTFNQLMYDNLVTDRVQTLLKIITMGKLSRAHKILYVLVWNKQFYLLYVLYRFFK